MSGAKFELGQPVIVDGDRPGTVGGIPLIDYKPRYMITFGNGTSRTFRWVDEAALEAAPVPGEARRCICGLGAPIPGNNGRQA